MATRRVATVFGGSGFIGRYVVKRLAASGYIVRVAVRDTAGALFLKPMGAVGQVVPLYTSLHEPATITRAVAGAHVVVNCVGILAEKRAGDFMRIQAEGAGRAAQEAAAAGVEHMVHVSAIGADPASPSLYARSKGEGERGVHAAFPRAVILRPSIVFGPEDQFFNRFGAMAQWSPFMPVIAGDTRFQPVYVGDVADAVIAGLTVEHPDHAIYELGGPKVWSFRGLLAWILKETQRRRRMIEVPPKIVDIQAGILERLPGKLLTRDQLILLARDNVVAPGAHTLADLKITPTPVELVVPQYLARFRPGGGNRERYHGQLGSNRT